MSNAVRTESFRLIFKPLERFSAPSRPIIPTKYLQGRGEPTQTPIGYFKNTVPAIRRWFEPYGDAKTVKQLNKSYLEPIVGLVNHPPPNWVTANFEEIIESKEGTLTFVRRESVPFEYLLFKQKFFIPKRDTRESIYLTQTPVSLLPQTLRDDLGTTTTFSKLFAKFDANNSSIWIGFNETRTPLHRDPNNNVFVQIAGKKRVRMFTPEAGQRIFDEVQRQIQGNKSGRIRDEDMFIGEEGRILEALVWGPEWGEGLAAAPKPSTPPPLPASGSASPTSGSTQSASAQSSPTISEPKSTPSSPSITSQSTRKDIGDKSSTGSQEVLVGWEAELEEGDAIVIPLGYWHALRGVSEGVNGSVRIANPQSNKTR
jgi:Cupin-like domain